MSRIVHINCPKCGGTLGMVGLTRVVKCRYCGTWSLVETPELVPEYFVKPKLTETEARRSLQRLLRDPDMPAGLLQNTRFHSARLYFIPYHELNARRLGTMTMTENKATRPSPPLGYGSSRNFDGLMGGREREILAPVQRKVDTRVIISDVSRLEPAVKLPEWALDEAELGRLRSDPEGRLLPADRKAMEKLGKVYDPTVSPDQLLAQCQQKVGAALMQDNTGIEEPRVKRIFYPVWRARYFYQGRLYGATLDGVTGKIMSARAPQDDRSRVLWLLGAAAPVSLVAGKLLGLLIHLLVSANSREVGIWIYGTAQFSGVLLPILLVGLTIAVFIMGVGWEQFRYAGELVIRGERRTVEKINRPPQTVFDKMLAVLTRAFDAYLQAAKSRQRGR